LVAISKQEIQGNHTVEVQVNVDSMNQQKVQQINMLLQQTQALQGQVPPMVIPALVAEIFSSFGKEEQAEEIRKYQPQPDPMQQQMMQLEMLKIQAEIAKYKAEEALAYAKVNNTDAQAQKHSKKHIGTDMDTISKAQEMEYKKDLHGVDIESKIAGIENMYHNTAISAKQLINKSAFENSK